MISWIDILRSAFHFSLIALQAKKTQASNSIPYAHFTSGSWFWFPIIISWPRCIWKIYFLNMFSINFQSSSIFFNCHKFCFWHFHLRAHFSVSWCRSWTMVFSTISSWTNVNIRRQSLSLSVWYHVSRKRKSKLLDTPC